MPAGQVFLSYNRCDAHNVRTVRAALEARDLPTFLDEHSQRAGQSWPQALERALNECSAVVVFVGSEVGNWQWSEIGFALDRQASEPGFPVIPVLLEGANTNRSFLFLNTWVDLRGDRFADPAALDKLIEAVRHSKAPAPHTELPQLNPFRGLEFFDEPHAPFFFGRESFIDDLFQRLTEARKNFVAVIGPSGSGKSSVVRAGLVPRLRRQRPPKETWDVAVFTPGDRPWFRLADALGALRFPDNSDADLDIEVEKLYRALERSELGLTSLLDRILQPQGARHRLLLVIDQFEELFTLSPPEQRRPFIDAVLGALHLQQIVIVPTLRADFYGQAIESDRVLSNLLGREQITLGRLHQEELRRAIVEPVRLAGLQFEPGLPELLLRDAGNEPGNLPLLQHALLELYVRRQGNLLTSRAYDEIGGIRRAIATSAEREYERLPVAHKPLARLVFTQLVRLARADEGLEDTRKRVPIGDLPPEARGLVDEFSGARLRLLVKAHERMLAARETVETVGDQETVEISHEALIREWERLQNWLNEDRGFYLWRQRLDQAIREYREHGGHLDYLMRGVALKEAEGKLAAPMPEPLGRARQDFIQRSLDERDRAQREQREAEERVRADKEQLLRREREALTQAADQERQAREAADRARQAEQQRRITAERGRRALQYGALALLAATLLAGYQWYRANAQRAEATGQTLALRANALRQRQKDTLAMLLAALSLRISPTQDARDAAISLFAQNVTASIPLRGHDHRVISVAYNPDGTRIISGSEDRTLRLWDARTGRPIGTPLRGHEGAVSGVAFSPDGFRIVSGSKDHMLRLWDARTGQGVGSPLRGHDGWITSVAFSPDGSLIVSGSNDKTLRLWDARTGKPIGNPLRGHQGAVSSVAFSPDGSRIVSGSWDNALRLWDARTGQLIGTPLSGHEGVIASVAYSRDGSRIVSGSHDTTLRLWDAHTRQHIATLRGHEGGVGSVAFSFDGSRIASAGSDNTLRLWDARTHQAVGGPLRGHDDWITSVAFSPDGSRLVSGSYDRTLRLWDARTNQPIGVPLSGHDNLVTSVAVHPDGSRIVSGSGDYTLRLWDAHTGQPIGDPLRGHEYWVSSVAFSPDGARIVSGSWDHTLRLWDARTGQAVGSPLRGHNGLVYSVAFSPDGARIVSGNGDNSLRLWDARTGQPIGDPLRGHEDWVTSVAFSPDGSRIVSGSHDRTLRLWDARTRQPIGAPLRGHEDWVTSVAFSPDGSRIVSGSEDRTLRLWEAHTGQAASGPLRGHEGPVSTVAFSPGGSRIVSGSEDRTLRLWDARTGQAASGPLRGHEDGVTSVAFTPDGSHIVSGSMDTTLMVLDVKLLESTKDLLAVLCAAAHRNLTRQEWELNVPAGESYRKVCDQLPLEE